MNQKEKEIGWMYHMTPKAQSTEPESYPPPSQIPLLNGEEVIPEEHEGVRGWIKDTDSKYIQLAKQGGRPDLLRFRENVPRNKGPKGYPRCEWFYIEDNKIDDQERVEDVGPYVPRLPDYMVHEAYEARVSPEGSTGGSQYQPSRLPYATDKVSVFQREGRSATDKTQRIPESRKTGYGIRRENDSGKVKKMPMPERAKRAVRGEPQGDHMPEDETAPVMGKIMSGTYEKEWHDRCEIWHKQGHSTKPKGEAMAGTVYQDSYGAPPPKREVKHGRRAGQSADQKRRDQTDQKEIDKEIKKMENELFKMSKFKNVPPRIDTHRHEPKGPKQEAVY